MHLIRVVATTLPLARAAYSVPTAISTFPDQDETMESTSTTEHVPGNSPFTYVGNSTRFLFDMVILNMIPNPCVLGVCPHMASSPLLLPSSSSLLTFPAFLPFQNPPNL